MHQFMDCLEESALMKSITNAPSGIDGSSQKTNNTREITLRNTDIHQRIPFFYLFLAQYEAYNEL